MKTFARFALAGSFVIGLSVTGFAQAPAPAPAAPAAPAPAPAKPKAAKPMDAGAKALAKECSAKASAQGLHGKARKEFREKCKKGEM
jgi:psiF repeat